MCANIEKAPQLHNPEEGEAKIENKFEVRNLFEIAQGQETLPKRGTFFIIKEAHPDSEEIRGELYFYNRARIDDHTPEEANLKMLGKSIRFSNEKKIDPKIERPTIEQLNTASKLHKKNVYEDPTKLELTETHATEISSVPEIDFSEQNFKITPEMTAEILPFTRHELINDQNLQEKLEGHLTEVIKASVSTRFTEKAWQKRAQKIAQNIIENTLRKSVLDEHPFA